jgi:RHS repeat-associated protein
MMTIGGFYNITGINGTFPDQSRRNWKNLPTAITKSGTTYNYRYDHAGLRVYKQEGDNIHTLRGAFGEVLAAYKNGLLDYWNIVRPDGVVIGRREGSNRLYYHRDHLGSTRAVVNASGSVVQTYDYYPFGLEMPGRSLTSGTTARERFTGHERDEEVGLDYMQARRYAAEFGRFMSVDPLADDAMQIHLTPYNYAWNNPVNITDPDGRCPSCVGALVGAGLDIAFQTIVEGKSLNEVDLVSVGISAAAGATGAGLISKANKLLSTGNKVNKATQLSNNVKQGAKFEKTVEKGLSKTDIDIAKQITVKTESGTKTRLDFVSKNKKTGQTNLTEAKSSQNAPLTANQKQAFPEIAKEGATVVGKGKGQFPGGTKIPPKKVEIIRPKN